MKNVFDISNFNLIEDEENYYFFRALNMADNQDIETKEILDENGKIQRIRTDRERYEENPENNAPKYNKESQLSLEQIYDHIKMHYRKDTNCISLSSNANVSACYGRGYYKDKYVMIKVPKKEMGERVINAGEYMLDEVEKMINGYISSNNIDKKILDTLQEIENSKTTSEIKNAIKQKYKSKETINPSKAKLRKGITYKSPIARISSYQTLNEEQSLEKNKIIAKLTVLERMGDMSPIISHTANNNLLTQTIGNAFSSLELIHYGDISKENIIEIPREIVDIFALIQQVEGIEKTEIENLKIELINAIEKGIKISNLIEIDETAKDNISIEDMYDITGGTVEYGKANSIVKNMFYLSKARKNAIGLSNILREILGNDSRFENVIQYIRDNCFRIEPEIISRKSNKGIKISESVNLDLPREEQALVENIKKLSGDNLEEVIENGGFLNIKDIITRTYGQEDTKIDKSKYYAEAIISQYNWHKIGIEEFKIYEKTELIKRLQEKNCIEIYNQLKQIGVEEKQIPTYLLNIATRQGFYEQYESGKLEKLLNEQKDILKGNINIEVVERFLGYYDIEGTGIKLNEKYQRKVFNNVNEIFEEHKFAQVILPTGAGKSFIALSKMQQYVKEHPNEKMLYLAPQDEIINQIKKYIVQYIHGKQDTIGKSMDEIVKEVFPNITFETYSGLLAKRGQEVIKEQYGMIVLDELHRTGAKKWEGRIDKLLENQNDNVKVLGITATPVRDVDGRDMAEETAKKLGYTDEEIRKRKHLASNMTLENAIRMGYVVNPKIVYCKYDLISSGKMDELKDKIDGIEDETVKVEKLKEYEELRTKLNEEIDAEIGEEARRQFEEDARKNLDSGIGKEEILKQNIKKGGKYIVFIPITDQGDIEDEDGNSIGTKTGEDKLKAYQDYLSKVFEGTEIVPQCHAMSGSWNGREKNVNGEDKNQQELNAFETDNSDETKFMIVMNKANEGLHIDGVDGIVWFRALDEDSRILYLQQLGRAIYALDEDNPIPDDKRPVVIDLANNSLTVKIDKDFEKAESIDDLEALIIVKEWIDIHDGILPDRNSSNKQEQHYYAILRMIQSKYSKYLDGFENFEDLSDEEKNEIQEIIDIASEIDLWNIELPPIPKTRGSKDEMNPFEISGILKDYVEFEDEIDKIQNKNIAERYIEFIIEKKRTPQIFKRNAKDLTEEERKEKNLAERWRKSEECKILKEYDGKPIEDVPEKYRKVIEIIRNLMKTIKEKTPAEQYLDFLKTYGRRPTTYSNKKKEQLSEFELKERNIYSNWIHSKEYEILNEYVGEPIEKVPEEYRNIIKEIRQAGDLGKKVIKKTVEKTTAEQYLDFLVRKGRKPKSISNKKVDECTEEEKEEKQLSDNWRRTKEYKILNEYAGETIEKVPKKYRNIIERIRQAGDLGKKVNPKTTPEQYIDFIYENGRKPIRVKKSMVEITKEEINESRLNGRWIHSKEYQILNEYEDEPIEKVPQEYREIIRRIRMAEESIRKETVAEEYREFLKKNKRKPRNSKTEEIDNEEKSLDRRWKYSTEYKILKEYEGQPTEKVPEKYRKIIEEIRELEEAVREKTYAEQYIDFIYKNGRRPRRFNLKKVEELNEYEVEEKRLYHNWKNAKEHKILDEYEGQPIENVPEEYREIIKKIRDAEKLVKKRKRPGKEIAEASISSLKDIEMADREYEVLNELSKNKKKEEADRKDE